MTKCNFFKYGASGTIEKLDALCLLPINILNEKIYIFFWFWLLFLAIISATHLICRILQFLIPSLRKRYGVFHISTGGLSMMSKWEVPGSLPCMEASQAQSWRRCRKPPSFSRHQITEICHWGFLVASFGKTIDSPQCIMHLLMAFLLKVGGKSGIPFNFLLFYSCPETKIVLFVNFLTNICHTVNCQQIFRS